MGDDRVVLEDEPGVADSELEARRLESEHGDHVPDAVAPPPHHPRFPLIDGMRAIAVLSVVLVHTTLGARELAIVGPLLAHMNIGVAVFFLISGFLLYRPFVAHRGGGAAAPPVVQYAKRRLLRIYPAYWLVLTVLVIAPGLTGVGNGDWWAQYGLVQTLPLPGGASGCHGFLSDCGLAQTWSLVIEMTFYAALPLYVVAAAHLARGRSVRSWVRLELLLLAVLSLVSVVLRFVVWDGTGRSWVAASVIGSVFWFALGMGLAVASVGLERRGRQPAMIRLVASRPWIPWALALAAYALLSAWLPRTPFVVARDQLIVVHLAFGVIAALLLLPAVFEDRSGGLPRRVLAHPVMAWLGLTSYGIFLWHYVITRQLGGAGANLDPGLLLIGTLAISIPCAAASYYLVERPLLRLKYRRVRDVVGHVKGIRRPSPAPHRVP
jgi:peptidoglycan/LPS O-acetylase OafA/YrhL